MFSWFTKRKLRKATTKDISYFDLCGQKLYARICDVYDGDSCTLIIKTCGRLYRVKCRLMGIDTAELRSKDPLEKEHAIKARSYMDQYLNKVVWAIFFENDKYGRSLVSLHKDNVCINDALIKEKLAYAYDGQGKKPFNVWFSG